MSHSFSAPIIATSVFVVLALLESATIVSTILSVVFCHYIAHSRDHRVCEVGRIGLRYCREKCPRETLRDRARKLARRIHSARTIRAPVLLSGLMLAYFINTSAMFLLTLGWKISVHVAGITRPLSFLVFKLGPAGAFSTYL